MIDLASADTNYYALINSMRQIYFVRGLTAGVSGSSIIRCINWIVLEAISSILREFVTTLVHLSAGTTKRLL